MTNEGPTPENRDVPSIGEAFDRLRTDVGDVSADAALRRIEADSRSVPWRPAVATLVAVALVVAGVVVLRSGSDDDVIAADPERDDGEPESTIGEPDITATADALDGTAWSLVAGTGPSGAVTIVEGWPITITFSGDAFGGTAACNGYGGVYELDADGPIGREIGRDDMGCLRDIQRSETAYLAALAVVEEAMVRDGRLVLTGPDGTELVYERVPSIPVDDLVGRTWRLTGLVRDGEMVAPSGGPATLRLEPDGTLSGSTGCRTLAGEWTIVGERMRFGSFRAEGDCSTGLADQDGLVVTVLGDGFTPSLDDDVLELTATGGNGLVYRLADDGDELPVADVPRLVNTQWNLASGTVPEGLLPQLTFTLDIGADGRVATGQAHCELYGVDFGRLLGGSGPVAEIDVDGTPAPCPLVLPAVGSEEFVQALLIVDEIAVVDDELILRGPDVDLRFHSRAFMGIFEFVFADRANVWVDVHGYLGDRGGGMFLCSLPPTAVGCEGFWVVLVGETPDPELIGTSVVVRGAMDEWGRMVVDPGAELRLPAFGVFEGFAGLPSDGAISQALLTAAVSDPALTWHPDGVVLSLGGTQHQMVRSPAELLDPANWVFEVGRFRGGDGRVSALESLAGGLPKRVYNGAHSHCAAVPTPLPEVDFDRQLVIEIDPTHDEFSSCLQWLVVDVLIDDGLIVAVNLDRWEGAPA
ncbi:MAG: META domain-containing protein [Actinomycetota bacterium]